MKPEGIIFDLDGTLLDSLEFWNHLGSDFIRLKGLIPLKDLDERLSSLSMEQGAALLKEEYLLKESERQILIEIEALLENWYLQKVQPFRGVKELLETLWKLEMPVAAATASSRPLIEGALKRAGLFSYFETIEYCSEAKAGKDQPKVYEQAAGAINKRPSRILVVEDDAKALKTAKKAGFLCTGILGKDADSSKRNKMNESAFQVFETIEDFSKYLKKVLEDNEALEMKQDKEKYDI